MLLLGHRRRSNRGSRCAKRGSVRLDSETKIKAAVANDIIMDHRARVRSGLWAANITRWVDFVEEVWQSIEVERRARLTMADRLAVVSSSRL